MSQRRDGFVNDVVAMADSVECIGNNIIDAAVVPVDEDDAVVAVVVAVAVGNHNGADVLEVGEPSNAGEWTLRLCARLITVFCRFDRGSRPSRLRMNRPFLILAGPCRSIRARGGEVYQKSSRERHRKTETMRDKERQRENRKDLPKVILYMDCLDSHPSLSFVDNTVGVKAKPSPNLS